MSGALDGLVVADFGRILSAPYATMLLGDLGATVVKVERPGSGDDTRAWSPPSTHGQATYFQSANRNKRSIALDLSDAVDLGYARRLVARTDVLVENFRPGTMRRFGLDYHSLRVAHPCLVYCAISGFGTGPGAALPGFDLLVQAVGGLMSLTGEVNGPPMKTGVAVADVLTGLHAVTGILAALHHRERTGEGQLIEVDLLSCLLSSMVNQAASHVMAGVTPQRMGNNHPSLAPYELFETADAPVVVAVGNDRQFRSLCDVVGRPDLGRRSALRDQRAARSARGDAALHPRGGPDDAPGPALAGGADRGGGSLWQRQLHRGGVRARQRPRARARVAPPRRPSDDLEPAPTLGHAGALRPAAAGPRCRPGRAPGVARRPTVTALAPPHVPVSSTPAPASASTTPSTTFATA